MPHRERDAPNMSDTTLLVNVEDLISMAMGPESRNKVNFKCIEMVLHILARQLRMLEQQVEIVIAETPEETGASVKGASGKAARLAGKHGDKGKADKKGKKTKDLASPKDQAGKKHEAEKEEKEKKQHEKEQKAEPKSAAAGADANINVKEVRRGGDKVLVVGKEKVKKAAVRPHVGNVDVVTQAEFASLEAAVRQLEAAAGQPPPPEPTLPDNEQLKKDLLEGSASLTDTMQAMQVNARVQAAEKAIGRMAGLMTQLVAAGVIPEDLVKEAQDGQLTFVLPSKEEGDVTEEAGLESEVTELEDVAEAEGEAGLAVVEVVAAEAPSKHSASALVSQRDLPTPVSKEELEEILNSVKDELTASIEEISGKAGAIAANAVKNTKTISEKLEMALLMDGRINELNSLVSDYAEQLNGFDAGLSTQMQGFQDQMGQIRNELKCGLDQLASAGNNTEAAALKELTESYEQLVQDLEEVNHTHQALYTYQNKLSDELNNLVESVEMLRDQKSDRDEVLDALRDKADISRLDGLLTEEKFAVARAQLERMLEVCHDKFKRQDKAWMGAMEDIMKDLETKAGQTDLLSGREEVQTRLQELHQYLQRLEEQLGDPVAALLMRHLGRGAMCGACRAGALMAPGKPAEPPCLPALRPPQRAPADTLAPLPPPGSPLAGPCITRPDDHRVSVRWAGGEHTLWEPGRQRAHPAHPAPAAARRTHRYCGPGEDGRLYHMEEELQPCAECNQEQMCRCEQLAAGDGAGDAARSALGE